jgi:hypothetical protein
MLVDPSIPSGWTLCVRSALRLPHMHLNDVGPIHYPRLYCSSLAVCVDGLQVRKQWWRLPVHVNLQIFRQVATVAVLCVPFRASMS